MPLARTARSQKTLPGKKTTKKGAKPRPRNAAATREAILQSARKAFAAHGYEGAGLREIAANAGVTAMLVSRYFGSKEQLFAEVIDDTMTGETIIRAGMPAGIGDYLASGVLRITAPGAPPVDGSLIMIRSASTQNAHLTEIGRRHIEKRHLKTLTDAIAGPHAAERAALILSMIAGVQIMRQMIGLTPLTRSSPEALHKLLAPVIQQLVDG